MALPPLWWKEAHRLKIMRETSRFQVSLVVMTSWAWSVMAGSPRPTTNRRERDCIETIFVYSPSYSPPAPVAGFSSRNSLMGSALGSIATSNQPIIISSQLWSPQCTSLVASGLAGLLGELSKCAMHSIRVPLGSTFSSDRYYKNCHLKPYFGTPHDTSRSPS